MNIKTLNKLEGYRNEGDICIQDFHCLFDGNLGPSSGSSIVQSLSYFIAKLNKFKSSLSRAELTKVNKIYSLFDKELNDFLVVGPALSQKATESTELFDKLNDTRQHSRKQQFIDTAKALRDGIPHDEEVEETYKKLISDASKTITKRSGFYSSISLKPNAVYELHEKVYKKVFDQDIYEEGVIALSFKAFSDSLAKGRAKAIIYIYNYEFGSKMTVSHAVMFHYKKVSSTNYVVRLINTGFGLENHIGTEPVFNYPLEWNATEEQLKRLIVVSRINSSLLLSDTKHFYAYIDTILSGKKKSEIKLKNQISGSCSFYSSFNTIKIMMEDQSLFDRFQKLLEKDAVDNCVKYMETNGVSPQWKNILDLLSYRNSIPVPVKERLYTIYIRNVMDYNSFTFDFPVINKKINEYIAIDADRINKGIPINKEDPNLLFHLQFITHVLLKAGKGGVGQGLFDYSNGEVYDSLLGNTSAKRLAELFTNYLLLDYLNTLLKDKYYTADYDHVEFLQTIFNLYRVLNEILVCNNVNKLTANGDYPLKNLQSYISSEHLDGPSLTRATHRTEIKDEISDIVLYKLTSILLKYNKKHKLFRSGNTNGMNYQGIYNLVFTSGYGLRTFKKEELDLFVEFSDAIFGSNDLAHFSDGTSINVDFLIPLINKTPDGALCVDKMELLREITKKNSLANGLFSVLMIALSKYNFLIKSLKIPLAINLDALEVDYDANNIKFVDEIIIFNVCKLKSGGMLMPESATPDKIHIQKASYHPYKFDKSFSLTENKLIDPSHFKLAEFILNGEYHEIKNINISGNLNGSYFEKRKLLTDIVTKKEMIELYKHFTVYAKSFNLAGGADFEDTSDGFIRTMNGTYYDLDYGMSIENQVGLFDLTKIIADYEAKKMNDEIMVLIIYLLCFYGKNREFDDATKLKLNKILDDIYKECKVLDEKTTINLLKASLNRDYLQIYREIEVEEPVYGRPYEYPKSKFTISQKLFETGIERLIMSSLLDSESVIDYYNYLLPFFRLSTRIINILNKVLDEPIETFKIIEEDSIDAPVYEINSEYLYVDAKLEYKSYSDYIFIKKKGDEYYKMLLRSDKFSEANKFSMYYDFSNSVVLVKYNNEYYRKVEYDRTKVFNGIYGRCMMYQKLSDTNIVLMHLIYTSNVTYPLTAYFLHINYNNNTMKLILNNNEYSVVNTTDPLLKYHIYGYDSGLVINRNGKNSLFVLRPLKTQSDLWINTESNKEKKKTEESLVVDFYSNNLDIQIKEKNITELSIQSASQQDDKVTCNLANYPHLHGQPINASGPFYMFYKFDNLSDAQKLIYKDSTLPRHHCDINRTRDAYDMTEPYNIYSEAPFNIIRTDPLFKSEEIPETPEVNGDGEHQLYVRNTKKYGLNRDNIRKYTDLESTLESALNDIKLQIISIMARNLGDYVDLVCNHYATLYRKLEIENLLDFIKKIKKMVDGLLDENEILRDFNRRFNLENIYDEPRDDFVIILVEITFNGFIWKNQFDVYKKNIEDITNAINKNDQNYSVYQLLMGSGKTEIITPLLITHFTHFAKLENRNVILSLPDHLVRQSLAILLDKFYQIFHNFNINFDFNEKRMGSTMAIENKLVNMESKYYSNTTSISLISDADLKIRFLNIKLSDHPSTTEEESLIKKSVLIFDEFDSLYNPMSSDLNYPYENSDLMTKEIINMNIINYFVEFIFFILKDREINFVPKEIDPESTFRMFQLYYNEVKTKIDPILSTVMNDLITNLSKEPMEDIESGYPHYEIYRTIQKFYIVLSGCMYTKFNQSYGLPKKDSHDNYFIAVPYSASDSPVIGSTFSDLDITIIYTTLSFLYNDFRKVDIVSKIIPFIKDHIETLEKTVPELVILASSKWFELLEITTTDRIKEIDMKHDITKITKLFNHRENKKEIMLYYLKKIIIPEIGFTEALYNCSFIDIMSSTFCEYKSGFSGTVNMNLPYYNVETLTRQSALIDRELTEYRAIGGSKIDKEFTNVHFNVYDEGAIRAALYGTFNTDFNKDYPMESINSFRSDIIEGIVNLLHKHSCMALIDVGAFFSNFTSDFVIKTISEIYQTKYGIAKREYIYVDPEDNKKVLLNDSGKISYYEYDGLVHDEAFIFYDNKHIVGIDIKQPSLMKGLATINIFNKYTETSQGIFRLRNLNNGHQVTFVLDSKIKGVDNRVDLFNFLWRMEKIYLHTIYEEKKLIQNLKYIRRKILNNKESYSEESLIPYKLYKNIEETVVLADRHKIKIGDEIINFIKTNFNNPSNDLINALFEKISQKVKQNSEYGISVSSGIQLEHQRAIEDEAEAEAEAAKEREEDVELDMDVVLRLIHDLNGFYNSTELPELEYGALSDFTVTDYLDFENKFKFAEDHYRLNANNLYISRFTEQYVRQLNADTFSVYDIMNDVVADFDKILNYKQMNFSHDKFGIEPTFFNKILRGHYYETFGLQYMVKDGKFFILSRPEKDILIQKIRETVVTDKFVIYNHNGEVIFNHSNGRIEPASSLVREPELIETYIRYLCGQRSKSLEQIIIIKFLKDNPNLENFIKYGIYFEKKHEMYRNKSASYRKIEKGKISEEFAELIRLNQRDFFNHVTNSDIAESNYTEYKVYINALIDPILAKLSMAGGYKKKSRVTRIKKIVNGFRIR